ncbi:MAG: Sulfoxide reductase catalytic subunit YedY [Verrucomicrobia subdivision 3 bacterium]|nr:Sulfoxide reductase catalytic subunit YedY [Limisphaerales bacterium]MCS1413043.1 Sulfoxide reductase catalytic subunit YedY [Limisphaerales bacterium]
MVGCSQNDSSVVPTITQDVQKFYGKGHSHPRNEELNPNWQLTNERTAATYNNFYEFTLGKDQVHRMVSTLIVSPREIDITGDIKKPQKIDAPRRTRLPVSLC